jgi:GTP-binding protein Era
MENQEHKAGFVNIIGKANVGKSTLMNQLVGEKLSIITSKIQTTRHRILGILNGNDFQIIYSDTPGIIENPSYELHKVMNSYVKTALEDADILLYVAETDDELSEEINERIRRSNTPLIIAINKIDLSNQEKIEAEIEKYQSIFPEADVVPISALHAFNIEKLFDIILNKIPASPPYYPKDQMTDKTMRFFVSEIIREKILENYQKEIPYSVQIDVESYKESENLISISATIYVVRNTQKAIIIGHQGKAIKNIGIKARKDIEEFTGKKIYLELFVKVAKDWRENQTKLKSFGYE